MRRDRRERSCSTSPPHYLYQPRHVSDENQVEERLEDVKVSCDVPKERSEGADDELRERHQDAEHDTLLEEACPA